MKNDRYTIAKVRIRRAQAKFLKELWQFLLIMMLIGVSVAVVWVLDRSW